MANVRNVFKCVGKNMLQVNNHGQIVNCSVLKIKLLLSCFLCVFPFILLQLHLFLLFIVAFCVASLSWIIYSAKIMDFSLLMNLC